LSHQCDKSGRGGAGGTGIANPIYSTPAFIAGGGGGGNEANQNVALGGSGIGGNGGTRTYDTPHTKPTSAVPNTGSGGGGGGTSEMGFGSSGIVIVRYVK